MEMRLFPALILFLGSYFPLSIILLVQDIRDSSWSAPICGMGEIYSCYLPELNNPGRAISLLVICSLSFIIFTWLMNRLNGFSTLEVIDSKSVPNDLINYVFPYVVSFMGLDLGDEGNFYGFQIFIGLMFLITYRSGQILMNPLLLVSGWQLYELNITTEGHRRCVRALSKDRVVAGDKLKSCLVHGIYVLHRG